MMRAHTNLYHSTIAAYPTVQGEMHKPLHRESLPIQQFLPHYPKQQKPQRFSNNIDSYTSGNPFAHLKNQINNLRSEFSKIIQKDGAKPRPDNSIFKKQERSMAQSVHVNSHQGRVNDRKAQTRIQHQPINGQNKEESTNFGSESIVRPYTFQSIKFGGDKPTIQATYRPDLAKRVQQLEKQNENLKNLNEQSLKQKQGLTRQLEKERRDKQQLIKEHKIDIDRMMLRNQQKLRLLQQIHQKDIKQVLQNLIKSQQTCKKISYQLIQKDAEYGKMQIQLKKTYKSIAQNRQQSKNLKLENEDLRRQVETSRKHKEQVIKDKDVCQHSTLRNENQTMLQQIQHLVFEAQQKQSLIRDLYRDISILDHEVHNNQHIRMVLSSTIKYVEQLNQNIIQLELSRLNQKYKQYY